MTLSTSSNMTVLENLKKNALKLICKFISAYGVFYSHSKCKWKGPLKTNMANIHQDGHSIGKMHVVFSNHVHSTHLCEANKCQI